ncbi:MAG: 5-bromo-4-chloroindolyl phosphate hydrolysis family protein [Cypionkella sp.]
MAQRIVGKYSPNADASPDQPKAGQPNTEHPVVQAAPPPGGAMLRANLAFLLPFPFIFKAFTGSTSALFSGLGAAGLLVLAAWLTREGVKAHAEYDARKIARRPALPRKIFGAALTGAALMTGAAAWQANPMTLFLFGMLGAILHLGSFGLDPLRGKGMEGMDTFQTDRVARAVSEGEKFLAGMKDAILRANDGALENRVDHFAATARNLFRQVENDPGDLTAARKYMSVYLMSARDATAKFADVYAASRSATARADYEALLTDLETNFASRTQALLSNDHTDLDVEIQVLRDRLKLEGPPSP